MSRHIGPLILRSSLTPHVPTSPCLRAPLDSSAFAGWDGCPQPSVRRPTHPPRSSSSSLSGQRRVGDNPPYPRQPLRPTCPLAQAPSPRRLRLRGLGTTRPTLRPLHKNKEPRTNNAPASALSCFAAVHHASIFPRDSSAPSRPPPPAVGTKNPPLSRRVDSVPVARFLK